MGIKPTINSERQFDRSIKAETLCKRVLILVLFSLLMYDLMR